MSSFNSLILWYSGILIGLLSGLIAIGGGMSLFNYLILWYSGILIGLLSGLVGIGGGTILLPLLINLGYSPIQSVATSSLVITLTTLSSCIRNCGMGYFDIQRVAFLATPTVIVAPLGVYLSDKIPSFILLICFGIFLAVNIWLASLRKNLQEQQKLLAPQLENKYKNVARTTSLQVNISNTNLARFITGGISGFLAGIFGIGGGAIMVPMQMLLLKENIKTAIQTSLGVILITSISNLLIYVQQGNISFLTGITLGIGGLCGAQVGSYYLPKLSDRTIDFIFNIILAVLSANMFWQAGVKYCSTFSCS
jgi:uncharacterized protein